MRISDWSSDVCSSDLAFTVRFIPMREDLATPAALGARDNPSRVAIDTVPQGAVLVIDGRGLADIAVFGDILAARVKQRGAAGIVTDGGVRDAAGVAEIGIPDRKRAGEGKSGSVRFDLGGSRNIKKKKQ